MDLELELEFHIKTNNNSAIEVKLELTQEQLQLGDYNLVIYLDHMLKSLKALKVKPAFNLLENKNLNRLEGKVDFHLDTRFAIKGVFSHATGDIKFAVNNDIESLHTEGKVLVYIALASFIEKQAIMHAGKLNA